MSRNVPECHNRPITLHASEQASSLEKLYRNGRSNRHRAAPSRSLSSFPHSTFGLRAIDETRFSIVDDATGALLEEMEASKAFFVV